jgi:hypothetical protein
MIMKNTRLAFIALVILTAMLFAFTVFQKTGTIKGKVTPANKAKMAWAISPKDTLHADVEDGEFEFKDVKAGTYSIIIEAQEPYSSTRKKDVVVSATAPVTDVGEIKLQPK